MQAGACVHVAMDPGVSIMPWFGKTGISGQDLGELDAGHSLQVDQL